MAVLGDVCENRDNGFNFLRLTAATGILLAHCLLVVPIENYNILGPNGGVRFGIDILLATFFVFSGFLIASSLERNCDLVRFYVARGLRIFPGLLVVALVLAFLIGPSFTVLSPIDYFTSAAVWQFPLLSSALLDSTAALPGLFEINPVENLVNMPIWTLRYEVVLYIGFPIYFLMFLKNPGVVRAIGLALPIAAYVIINSLNDAGAIPQSLQNLLWFGASFTIGAALWLYRKEIPNGFIWVLIFVCMFFVTHELAVGKLMAMIAAGYAFVWLAFLKEVPLKAYNRFGDYSYGIYIIHFPVAQLIYQLNPSISAVTLSILTFAITLPSAIVLWGLIEQRCLKAVKPCSNAVSSTIAKINGRSLSRS